MKDTKPQIQVLQIVESLPNGPEYTPWWFPEDDDRFGPLDRVQLQRLGFSEDLIRDGRLWAKAWEVWSDAQVVDEDWPVDPPQPLDFDKDPAPKAAQVDAELRRRGEELARRSVEAAPSLWVLDPGGDWHVGTGAVNRTWQYAVNGFEERLLLGLPAGPDDVWPWWFDPAGFTADGAWRVPLPRDFGWGEAIEEATARYARAMWTASSPRELERAWALGRLALEAMQGCTAWMDEDFQPHDMTGRSAELSPGTRLWTRKGARDMREKLRTLAADTPAPPIPKGEWYAYAPLSGTTFDGWTQV